MTEEKQLAIVATMRDLKAIKTDALTAVFAASEIHKAPVDDVIIAWRGRDRTGEPGPALYGGLAFFAAMVAFCIMGWALAFFA